MAFEIEDDLISELRNWFDNLDVDFFRVGSATAIGEQPIKGLLDPAAGARLSVAESLTNLMFACSTDLKDVKCSGNWMWPAKQEGEGAALLDACVAMCNFMKDIGIAIDGGKDSLSMAARVNSEVVKAPGTLVISSYVGCSDIRLTVTPDLKCPDGKGVLIYLPMRSSSTSSNIPWRLGGSALAQCFKQLGNDVPDVEPYSVVCTFNVIQSLIKDSKLASGHDISDGGLITCLLEMAFGGNCGLIIDIPLNSEEKPLNVLFAEEVGAVIEVKQTDLDFVVEYLNCEKVPFSILGKSIAHDLEPPQIFISIHGTLVLESSMTELRDMWEETSFVLERRQASLQCVRQEQTGLKHRIAPPYSVNFDPDVKVNVPKPLAEAPKIAIIREEGSNGDREMAAAFSLAGFEAWDINMVDLMDKKVSLSAFRGVAFVGGFSYADVCGSAKGWAATARFNSIVQAELYAFWARPDTFSFGVCNGCQLMALLGWVAPDTTETKKCSQGLLLDHNTSGRYESRFSSIQVQSSPALMLKGMEGTIFGMWVSHGEGRMVFKRPDILHQIETCNLAAIKYVDDQGIPTEAYPLNPNGSPSGIAGICSPDGRHLALMPHPERCVWTWQCPWVPESYGRRGAQKQFSPWIKLFQNAYAWCCQ
ncbi:phosphoribosylformylglycinamidine synthase-like [Plakobranchus ocellatus]|uniref:Phosphoribosylformylglycinamidine synthase-like n=1 Tax=Plakobranchus ocellatus TaxID=259542 RepID=A0AAV4BF96_9GAST|nr:phosphoribosylformylglycinamidine synthase-like [Plakobranchus ocellatus]